MPAALIDGRARARVLTETAAARAAVLAEKGVVPRLAVVVVGDDPAGLSYSASRTRALAAAGMEGREFRLPADAGEARVLEAVAALGADPAVHGILVQFPLPADLDAGRIAAAIDPAKDVDCANPVSVGNMALGRGGFLPCTPAGIMEIIRGEGIPTRGARAVVVGRSDVVGRPLATLLSGRGADATVTLCHSATADLGGHTSLADILILAAGSPGFVTADMVRPGATVIDAGISRMPDGSIRGDAAESVAQVAGRITPVPGGVGPVTAAMLLSNLVRAAEEQHGRLQTG